jgi:hypothetical protein
MRRASDIHNSSITEKGSSFNRPTRSPAQSELQGGLLSNNVNSDNQSRLVAATQMLLKSVLNKAS